MEHDAEPLRLLSWRRQVEAGSGRLDALLRPADALRHGRLGHEEGPGDLGGRQAADGPQGQRDLRRGRQRRVAAQEQQREGVVAGGATGFEVGVHLATGGRGRSADGLGLLPPAAGGVAAQLVGEATRRHRHQPPSGILRPSLHRPLGRGRQQRLLDGVLAGVEVAVAAHQRTEHLRDQPPDGPPVGHGSTLASCMRGRTSTPQ
jgi:hypothetical protein